MPGPFQRSPGSPIVAIPRRVCAVALSMPSSLQCLSARQPRATPGHGRCRGEVPNRIGPSAEHSRASTQEDTAKFLTARTKTLDGRLLMALKNSNETAPGGYHARLHYDLLERHPTKLIPSRPLQRRALPTARQQPRQRPLKLKQQKSCPQTRLRQWQVAKWLHW